MVLILKRGNSRKQKANLLRGRARLSRANAIELANSRFPNLKACSLFETSWTDAGQLRLVIKLPKIVMYACMNDSTLLFLSFYKQLPK